MTAFRSVMEWLDHEKKFHLGSDYLSAINRTEHAVHLLDIAADELREAANLVANDQAASFWVKLADEIDDVLDKKRGPHV